MSVSFNYHFDGFVQDAVFSNVRFLSFVVPNESGDEMTFCIRVNKDGQDIRAAYKEFHQAMRLARSGMVWEEIFEVLCNSKAENKAIFAPAQIVIEDEGDFTAEQGDDEAKDQAWGEEPLPVYPVNQVFKPAPTDEQYYAHFHACERMGVSPMSPCAPTIEDWLRDGDRAFFQ